MLAIDQGDTPERVSRYMAENRFTFDTALAGMSSWDWIFMGDRRYGVLHDYGITAWPTTYVIDPEGRVAARMVDFDEAALRAALAKQGVGR